MHDLLVTEKRRRWRVLFIRWRRESTRLTRSILVPDCLGVGELRDGVEWKSKLDRATSKRRISTCSYTQEVKIFVDISSGLAHDFER
jgi:hypothetical protein